MDSAPVQPSQPVQPIEAPKASEPVQGELPSGQKAVPVRGQAVGAIGALVGTGGLLVVAAAVALVALPILGPLGLLLAPVVVGAFAGAVTQLFKEMPRVLKLVASDPAVQEGAYKAAHAAGAKFRQMRGASDAPNPLKDKWEQIKGEEALKQQAQGKDQTKRIEALTALRGKNPELAAFFDHALALEGDKKGMLDWAMRAIEGKGHRPEKQKAAEILEGLAEEGNIEATFQRVVLAYQQNDFKTVVLFLQKASRGKDSPDQQVLRDRILELLGDTTEAPLSPDLDEEKQTGDLQQAIQNREPWALLEAVKRKMVGSVIRKGYLQEVIDNGTLEQIEEAQRLLNGEGPSIDS